MKNTYKVEVQADSTGTWCGNGLTFDTIEEAETYAKDLMSRWFLVQDWRVVDNLTLVAVSHRGVRREG